MMKLLCGDKWKDGLKKMTNNPTRFPLALLLPKYRLICKIFQFNIQSQIGHLHIVNVATLISIYACEMDVKLNIADLILKNFGEAKEKLVLPCFLTLVLKHFGNST